MAKEKQVPEWLCKRFPEYTRKELYFMLYPMWTGVTDRFKKKKSDVSSASITIKGFGRFEFKSTAKMKKTASKFKRRKQRKARNYRNKQLLKTDKLIY